MIIWGTRSYIYQLAMITLLCGRCGNPSAHALRRRVMKFTLFFIPLFPISSKYSTQCTFWWCADGGAEGAGRAAPGADRRVAAAGAARRPAGAAAGREPVPELKRPAYGPTSFAPGPRTPRPGPGALVCPGRDGTERTGPDGTGPDR